MAATAVGYEAGERCWSQLHDMVVLFVRQEGSWAVLADPNSKNGRELPDYAHITQLRHLAY
jgi:hypothetical protein